MEELPGDEKKNSEHHIQKSTFNCSCSHVVIEVAAYKTVFEGGVCHSFFSYFFYQKIILINCNDKSVKVLTTGE